MRCVVRKLGEDASLKDAFDKRGKFFKGESVLLVEPFADERQNAAHVEFESVAHGDIFTGNLQYVEDDMQCFFSDAKGKMMVVRVGDQEANARFVGAQKVAGACDIVVTDFTVAQINDEMTEDVSANIVHHLILDVLLNVVDILEILIEGGAIVAGARCEFLDSDPADWLGGIEGAEHVDKSLACGGGDFWLFIHDGLLIIRQMWECVC